MIPFGRPRRTHDIGDSADAKETRNPKPEIRNPNETQNPKPKTRKRHRFVLFLGFWFWTFIRISGFWFRVYRFTTLMANSRALVSASSNFPGSFPPACAIWGRPPP